MSQGLTKRLLVALLLLAAVFAGGALVEALFLGTEAPPVVPDAAPEPEVPDAAVPDAATDTTIKVVSASGGVERRSEGGDWAPISEGDEVPVSDSIRTLKEGSAIVKLGLRASIEIPDLSGVTIEGQDQGNARVRLDKGRARVKVSGGAVRMKFEGSDAEATTREGAFSALTTGKGHVAVANEDAVVELSAAGETVAIPAGHQSAVMPNAKPSAPQPIPSSLFLKVRRPDSVTRAKATVISGSAAPGALVTVKGVTVRADDKGRWSVKVPLKEGKNILRATAVDVMGRREGKRIGEVMVDRTAPKAKGDVDW